MKRLFFLLIITGLLLYACSGGGGGSSQGQGTVQGVRVSGKISGLSPSQGLNNAIPIAQVQGIPSHVWAIPIAKIQGADVDPINVFLRQSQSVSGDGSFSFVLPKSITAEELEAKFPDIEIPPGLPSEFELDWIIVTVDTSTKPVTLIDFIQLAENSGYEDLMLLPISQFTSESYDLGTITDGSSEKTTDTIETVSTVTGNALKTLSRADNIMQSLKDVIQNCDIENEKCYEARQSFAFNGTYANIGAGFDRADSYSGYQFYLDLNDYYGPSDFDNICPGSGSPSVIYTLAPPQDITVNGRTYGPSNPLTTGTDPGSQEQRGSDEMVCSQGKQDVFLWKRKNDNNQWYEWGLQFITGDSPSELTTQMPPGQWSLRRNGTEIARFEFQLASPVDSNGNPVVFVPAIRLRNNGGNVNPGDPITMVEIKWYRWDNDTQQYVEITGDDLNLLDDLAADFELSIADWDGIQGDPTQRDIRITDLSFRNTSSVDVSDPYDGKGPFYYDYNNNDRYSARYIGLYYQFGGQGFRFVWRPDI